MSKTVILAEKPSQAKAYAEAFQSYEKHDGFYRVKGLLNTSETVITFGYGHLVELYDAHDYNDNWKKWQINNLPIFPEQYKFKISKDKKKQYNIVKGHLDSANEIIVATDSDREGEAIARLIIRLSSNHHKPIKRLWINSLETNEIKKGFKELRNGEDYYSTFKSAETRQIADWLVGINLTRLYTLYMQENGLKGTFTIGRVQTPTLYLIFQRNQEIKKFTSKNFYELYADFKHTNGIYRGKYKKRFDTKNEINSFTSEHDLNVQEKAVIKKVNVEEKKNFAPKLFALSDLQSLANKKFKYSADKTLSIAQKLYEKQILSYPRSDSNYIGTPEFNYLKSKLDDYLELINEEIKEPQTEENKRFVNSEKVQEHYAIIPTKTLPKLNDLSQDEQNIYLLVVSRMLAIFETPYRYEETTIETMISDVLFETKGKTEIDKGWKRLIKDNKDSQDTILPPVKETDTVDYELETRQGETKPPSYYTEGTLLTAMKNVGNKLDDKSNKDILKETEGIGTEATRSNVIETLKKQEYITIKKGKIYVTDKGNLLCEMIADDEITNAEMTATWEKYLKQIQENKGTQEAFLKSIQNFIEHLITQVPKKFKANQSNIKNAVEQIEEEDKVATCPNCQNAIVDKGKFYGCTGYSKGCKFSLPKKWSGKTLTQKNIQDLIEKKKTSKIKNFKSKKGNRYSAYLLLTDDYKIDMEFS